MTGQESKQLRNGKMPHEDSHAWQYSISASPLGSWLLEDLQSFHLPPQLNIS